MLTKKERLLCLYVVVLGLAALSSIVSYGVTGAFWWVETTRADAERAFILGMLHVITTVGGIVGAVALVIDWLETDADGV